MAKKEITADIKKVYATLSENEKGYSMKFTATSWNGNKPKYDIRTWKDNKGLKGVTLTKEELKALQKGIEIALKEEGDDL